MKKPPRGKFIVLDGGEGAGKTCTLTFLKENIPAESVEFGREPGNTDVGEGVRNILLDPDLKMGSLTEVLLFSAARAENVLEQIRPAIESGKHFITDRFASTTFAYQICGRQRRDLLPLFDEINRVIFGDIEPDLYIYLELELEIGKARARDRGKLNRLDKQEDSFYNRAYPGYREYLRDKPHAIVDASKPQQEVCEAVLSLVLKILNS